MDGGSYRYRGQWRDGLRHGQGECEYADGSRYVGAWEGGRRSGAGRHSTRDGSSYVGGWEDDAMHGKGRPWRRVRMLCLPVTHSLCRTACTHMTGVHEPNARLG